jgi:hypothetical protein
LEIFFFHPAAHDDEMNVWILPKQSGGLHKNVESLGQADIAPIENDEFPPPTGLQPDSLGAHRNRQEHHGNNPKGEASILACCRHPPPLLPASSGNRRKSAPSVGK